jgi:hypothetical protein
MTPPYLGRICDDYQSNWYIPCIWVCLDKGIHWHLMDERYKIAARTRGVN